MTVTIDTAFVKQFESEVHTAYQRMGSKLRNTVRVKNSVTGMSTTFQKIGKGTAGKKARNGVVPIMNLDHTAIECILQDYYAGDWVDKLDELKINHDERAAVSSAGAYALGRKTDEMIIDELAKTTLQAPTTAGGLTLAKVQEGIELLGNKDVPDDGDRYAVIGWKQWAELLGIKEFASADYVGPDELPFNMNIQAKKWLGTMWIPHSGLPMAGTDRSIFWYHKNAIGHAVGADVQSDITWHGDKASHFVNNMMSQGSALIDSDGVLEIICSEA